MVSYSEIIQLDDTARELAIKKLSKEDVNDLIDQVPFRLSTIVQESDRLYFNTADDLYEYVLHNFVPASKPWQAAEIVGHEVAHTDCAIAVGATSIKYSVSLIGELGSNVFAHYETPNPLPRLALAAISMNPFDSTHSRVDVRNIREDGYYSREHVIQRIERWNSQHNEFVIPEPRSEQFLFVPTK